MPNCDTKMLDWLLDESASLEPCLVLKAPFAWKVFHIRRLSRQRPATVVNEPLSLMEIGVLNDLPNARNVLPTGPYIRTTGMNLARVAGFLSTTRQGLPSDTVVWNAFRVIKPMVAWDEALIARANAATLELDSSL